MKAPTIAVIGAAGQTGREVVAAALARGCQVRALDLHRGSLPSNAKLTVTEGSVLDEAMVARVIADCDVVVSELGVSFGSRSTLVSEGNRVIIRAMELTGIWRLITQSAFGASESRSQLPWYLRLLASSPIMRPMYEDKDRMEALVTQSKLDWTILRPVVLTNQSATGRLRVGSSIEIGLTAHSGRADVAAFILEEIERPRFIHQRVTLAY